MTALAQAIERHRAAQAAIDAAGPEGYPDHLSDEEDEALSSGMCLGFSIPYTDFVI